MAITKSLFQWCSVLPILLLCTLSSWLPLLCVHACPGEDWRSKVNLQLLQRARDSWSKSLFCAWKGERGARCYYLLEREACK